MCLFLDRNLITVSEALNLFYLKYIDIFGSFSGKCVRVIFFFFLSTIFPNHAKFEQTFTFRRMGIPCLFWPYVNYRWLICALILFEPLYNSCIYVLNSCFSPSTEFIKIFRFYAVETLPFSLWSDYILMVWSFWKHCTNFRYWSWIVQMPFDFKSKNVLTIFSIQIKTFT